MIRAASKVDSHSFSQEHTHTSAAAVSVAIETGRVTRETTHAPTVSSSTVTFRTSRRHPGRCRKRNVDGKEETNCRSHNDITAGVESFVRTGSERTYLLMIIICSAVPDNNRI